MSVLIRRLGPQDVPALVATINSVCAEGMMATTSFQPTPAWTHALEETRCPCHLLLVADDAGSIVGWCRLFPEGAGEKGALTLGIGLRPAYRDRGLGSALVRRALRWAARAGYRCVHLSTRPDNARAIRAFSRCGFGFDPCMGNGLLEMSCPLPPAPNRQGEQRCTLSN